MQRGSMFLTRDNPRVRHADAKMEVTLVSNFMEKRVVFKLRPWSMISRKRGCFHETTSMDLKMRGCFSEDNHHSLENSRNFHCYAPMIVIHSLNFVVFIKYNLLFNLYLVKQQQVMINMYSPYFICSPCFIKEGRFLKAKFSMFCHKKGGKIHGKIHGKGLKLSPTDKRGFHFCAGVPYPGDNRNTPYNQPSTPLSHSVAQRHTSDTQLATHKRSDHTYRHTIRTEHTCTLGRGVLDCCQGPGGGSRKKCSSQRATQNLKLALLCGPNYSKSYPFHTFSRKQPPSKTGHSTRFTIYKEPLIHD